MVDPSLKGEDGTFKFVPLEVAERVASGHRFVTHKKSHVIWVYGNGSYAPDGEELIREEVRGLLGDEAKENRVNEVVAHIRETTYTEPEKFESPKNLINLKNGILNLETDEFSEHTPNILFINELPIERNASAKCPEIMKFLTEILHPDDIPVVQEIVGYCLLRDYRFAKAAMFLGAGSNGKCQGRGDKILMSDGSWKNVEDIKVGDIVISPQIDRSCIHANVISTHSRFEEDVYEVREKTRKRRLFYTCAENHEIPIIRTYTERTSKDDSTPRKKERRLFKYNAKRVSQLWNEKSEICSFTTPSVEYSHPTSKIDPYCLGAWLGDGHYSVLRTEKQLCRAVGITLADENIIKEFERAYPFNMIKTQIKRNSKAKTYRFSLKKEFVGELTRLGLGGKGSGNKSIPKECLLSDVNYRRELLAGLVDTDGFVAKINEVRLYTKSKQLAEDVKTLVFSLGGFSSIREFKGKIKSIGFVGNYYDVSIQFKDCKKNLPLRTWKKTRLRTRRIDPRNIAIECVKTKPQMVYGFEIDSPSKWYVTNEWMVTHNSTLLNLISALLGEKNVATPALQDLIYNRFSKADLYGKLANIHADIPNIKLRHTGVFKMLTGQDIIWADVKQMKAFEFRNYAKLFYSTNELPQTDDMTDAFWRRWIIIDFPNIFPERTEGTDPNILEKLVVPRELSGFLNWALEGLKRLLKQGGFTMTKTREEIETEWVTRTDSLRAFVMKHVSADSRYYVVKDDFYAAYQDFCTNFEVPPVEKGMVGRRLPTLFPKATEFHPKVGDKQQRAWRGIHLSDPYEHKNMTDISGIISYSSKNNKDKSIIIKNKGRNIRHTPKWLPCEFQTDHPRRSCPDPDDDSKMVELGPFEKGDIRGLPAQLANFLKVKGIVRIVGQGRQADAPARDTGGGRD